MANSLQYQKKRHWQIKKIIEYKKNKSNILYGYFGIRVLSTRLLPLSQIEAIRRTIAKVTKKLARLWFRTSAGIFITKKSDDSRMGKGVGKQRSWFYLVYTGCILYELGYISSKIALPVLSSACKKLSVSAMLVARKL